jgi:hypothetical protein
MWVTTHRHLPMQIGSSTQSESTRCLLVHSQFLPTAPVWPPLSHYPARTLSMLAWAARAPAHPLLHTLVHCPHSHPPLAWLRPSLRLPLLSCPVTSPASLAIIVPQRQVQSIRLQQQQVAQGLQLPLLSCRTSLAFSAIKVQSSRLQPWQAVQLDRALPPLSCLTSLASSAITAPQRQVQSIRLQSWQAAQLDRAHRQHALP